MSKIDHIIAPRSYEVVLNRIGEILADELNEQFVTYGVEEAKVTIYKERTKPYAPADVPALSVCLEHGKFESQHQGQATGMYRFSIEACTMGKFTDDERGDTISALRCQRLLGLCWGILEDTVYKTLGFAPPFLMHRHVEDIFFAKAIRQDAEQEVSGKLTLVVNVPETVQLLSATIAAGYDTNVKLAGADGEYTWTVNNP